MLLKWTPDLSVKNEGLDAEHQRWINILNGFYEGVMQKQSKEVLKELIVKMIDYTKYHFASEEKYMKSLNYPKLAEHQEKHRLYIEKITEFNEKINSGKLILSLEVTSFLKTWLIEHIKGSDQEYTKFAAKK
jgi:hemerythrin